LQRKHPPASLLLLFRKKARLRYRGKNIRSFLARFLPLRLPTTFSRAPAAHVWHVQFKFGTRAHKKALATASAFFMESSQRSNSMPQAFVHHSRRFENQIELRSSSSDDFSGTAMGGRKIKQRGACSWRS